MKKRFLIRLLIPLLLASGARSIQAGAPSEVDPAAPGSDQSANVVPSAVGVSATLPASTATTLDLYVGQATVIGVGEVKRIVIGSGKVIQATALDNGQVLVIPEAPGQSTLHLWDQKGRQHAYVVNVIAADAARLLSEIRAVLGSASNLSARAVGDKIVIEGSNLTEEQAARLSEVARRYPQVMNLVSRVGFERMIALDVRMLEIRRDRMEQVGIRWNSSMTGPAFTVVGDLHRSTALRPGGLADGVPGIEARNLVRPFASALGIASSITSMVDLMVQNGDAVILAEPSLSCRSGGNAKFLAGGELPIPYSSGMGTVSVLFKEYGIRFDVAPLASESGVIAAKIVTEISAINFELVVKDVPGITKRRAETEVNLREHETLVIAGLISDDSSRSIDRVPALGDLPILGALFRSRAFRDRQSELVVFITPRFVDPLKPGEGWKQGGTVLPRLTGIGSSEPSILPAERTDAVAPSSRASNTDETSAEKKESGVSVPQTSRASERRESLESEGSPTAPVPWESSSSGWRDWAEEEGAPALTNSASRIDQRLTATSESIERHRQPAFVQQRVKKARERVLMLD